MKVLLKARNFLPHLGGVERHVFTLARYLQENGVELTILTGTKEIDPEADKEFHIERVLHNKTRRFAFQWLYHSRQQSNEAAKIINKMAPDYDLVHLHSSANVDRIDKSVKIVSTSHGIGSVCIGYFGIDDWCGEKPDPIKCSLCVARFRPRYTPFLPAMIAYNSYNYGRGKKHYDRVDMKLCVSQYVYDVLYNTYPVDNMKVMYNFIDIENDINFYKEQIDPVYNEKVKTLIFSGRVDHQKGVSLMLESFTELSKTRDDLKLIITGSGDLRNMVQDYANKYDNIVYEGFVPRLRQLELIAGSDIFLAPSIYPDACPTSIMEALAFGKPVIGTFAGGIPEISEDKVEGYLAKPGDGDDLARVMNMMVNEDTSKYEKACLEKSRFFDIKRIGPQISKEYEALIG